MNSKVKITKRLRKSPDGRDLSPNEQVLVVDGKLLLVDRTGQSTVSYFKDFVNRDITHPLLWSAPIIISERENIEVGDWVIYGNVKASNHLLKQVEDQHEADHYNLTSQLMNDMRRKSPAITVWSAKVLALPEHFSKEQLQAIIDHKLNDQQEFMIECDERRPFTEKGFGHYYVIKLPLILHPAEVKKLSIEDFNTIADLRIYLLNHPDKEMVKAACLHYLGDKFQAFAENNEQMYSEEMVRVAFLSNPKSFVGVIGDRSDETAWQEFKKKNLIKGRHGN